MENNPNVTCPKCEKILTIADIELYICQPSVITISGPVMHLSLDEHGIIDSDFEAYDSIVDTRDEWYRCKCCTAILTDDNVIDILRSPAEKERPRTKEDTTGVYHAHVTITD